MKRPTIGHPSSLIFNDRASVCIESYHFHGNASLEKDLFPKKRGEKDTQNVLLK